MQQKAEQITRQYVAVVLYFSSFSSFEKHFLVLYLEEAKCKTSVAKKEKRAIIFTEFGNFRRNLHAKTGDYAEAGNCLQKNISWFVTGEGPSTYPYSAVTVAQTLRLTDEIYSLGHISSFSWLRILSAVPRA